ncbi:hypothetical protein GA0004734_00041110 [Rhizobium sp. 9140]|nr:hypothetical protein GA0004734_00041110 [Rhizobium sp. 9140]
MSRKNVQRFCETEVRHIKDRRQFAFFLFHANCFRFSRNDGIVHPGEKEPSTG